MPTAAVVAGPEPEIATPGFSDDQRRIVAALLRAVAENGGGAG